MRHRIGLAVTALLIICVIARGAAQTAAPINNDQPRIVFSSSPAVLIRIDGEPVYRGVEGTDLQRITNTTAFIVREPSGLFYMKVRHGWLEAYVLTGDWTVAGAPPEGANDALRRAVAAQAIDLIDVGQSAHPDSNATLLTGLEETIYVATTPTELIVTDGPARFVPFAGTALQYVENTTAHVFRQPTDGELFVFASGRWYRSWTTDGPWRFVAPRDLPVDVANIPYTSLTKSATPRPQPKRQ